MIFKTSFWCRTSACDITRLSDVERESVTLHVILV